MSLFSKKKKNQQTTDSAGSAALNLPDDSRVIEINEDICLTAVRNSDTHFLVQYMNDQEIFNNTLNIPNPYFESDAEWFISTSRESDQTNQFRTNWIIRDRHTGALMGGIGRLVKYGNNSHKDEIGYWLARPYWNKGIMTEVVRIFCTYLQNEHHLIRIEAYIYWFNTGSQRVLEKSGFLQEGVLRKFTLKGQEYRDCILFAMVKDNPAIDQG
jgi:RimJ/RimL family protein N-acetyltransferase